MAVTNSMVLVGDHPVMDLLNTVVRQGGGLVDLLGSDADVLRWLERAGLAGDAEKLPPGRLVDAARRLREMVRRLVTQRKDGRRMDAGPLNEFLALGRSYCELRQRAGAAVVVRRYEGGRAEAQLARLAEMAAEFLAAADFDLVRRCEGEGCVLWFYDRTKAHRRRWCSMKMCGNRHKVAAFRERQ